MGQQRGDLSTLLTLEPAGEVAGHPYEQPADYRHHHEGEAHHPTGGPKLQAQQRFAEAAA